MSNRKLKNTKGNIENLCPIPVGKRARSTPTAKSWKKTKFEAPSSPSILTTECLEEMGIGMLESEESSSSASAIALAVSTSADENSNEATPNLDAPKFCHQHLTQRTVLDHYLDNSSDNANSSYNDSIDSLKTALTATTTTTTTNNKRINSNNNNNKYSDSNCNSFDAFNDEVHQLQQLRKNADKLVLCQNKKVAILGAGAGLISNSNIHNSNSSSPTSNRNTRSPLTPVACNSYYRNANTNSNTITTSSSNTTHAMSDMSASAVHVYRPHSPSMPSTSQQAALLIKQQQQQHLLQLHQSKEQYTQPRFVPNENFFLYRNKAIHDSATSAEDRINALSDEMILQIFKWLPKKALMRCSYVCRKFNRCAADESLWSRLDLGGRSLRAGALQYIIPRGVVVLRLAQAELAHPVFDMDFLENSTGFQSKLQYLDLSMTSITKPSLKMLLSYCRQLKKISLEHVPLNDEICNEISKNTNLEALNLTMCTGLEAWSIRKMMESLQKLNSLNISWTNLSVEAVTAVVTNITPNIMRLNMAGCRKTMFDSHLATLAKRCTQILELDLSDCTGLTGGAIAIAANFEMLAYISLSRCYLIPPSSYTDLVNIRSLNYLDVFGMLSETAMETLERNFPNLGINKFLHSSVARPTVGTRRTSIWGQRTRD